MHLEILTPDRVIFSGDIESVNLPGSNGSFSVLKNHAALISSLDKGNVKVKTADGKNEQFVINGGVVEVLNNKIVVLA